MRVLVTGSRDWADAETVLDAFREVGSGAHTLVSGGARGADRIAEIIAAGLGWIVEQHPADWTAYGRSAGYKRNAVMVDLGADVCLAFIRECNAERCIDPKPHQSHGARHTADLAEKRGIPTRRWIA